MDPDETMKWLRDAMIEVSDLTSYLRVEGSALRPDQIEAAVDAAERIVQHGQDLIEFLGRSNWVVVRS